MRSRRTRSAEFRREAVALTREGLFRAPGRALASPARSRVRERSPPPDDHKRRSPSYMPCAFEPAGAEAENRVLRPCSRPFARSGTAHLDARRNPSPHHNAPAVADWYTRQESNL